MAMKFHSSDHIIVITGKDKGKMGIIKKFSSDKKKVLVKGINYIKKHQKGVPSQNINSGIVKKEAFIDLSNIAIFNPDTKKPDRIGFKIQSGKKIRFLKSNHKIIE
ncbi:50S ribosomal protein L24 [Buchnera aphidicola]|uniref:50S ribosomal protein L24 n=1 Tax=Buchnera aphidicola TaxID=9 RepID=UPI003464E0E7